VAVEATNDPISVLAIVVLLAIVFVVVERWRTATPAGRRALAPLLWAGPPVLVVAAVSIARDYLDVSLSSGGDTALDWAQLVYTAIPLAFLAGVLRELVEAAGAAEGLALENARLQAELRAHLELRRGGDGGAAADAAPALEGALAELTPRELEVLALLAEGRTDRGIAQELYVTPKTVEAHVRSVFRKLDLPAEATDNRRVHAVLTFLRSST
jgi:DNA-binding CsgD family transcriptional regulator